MKPSTQNYLKAIVMLEISLNSPLIKMRDISKRLQVSQPAVADMIKKLEASDYVQNVPYRGVNLTEKGRHLGMQMIRHHRLWETFLQQELNIPFDRVHDEAELLEHAGSDYLIGLIEKKLGFPTQDPHGNPIPDQELRFPG